MSSRVTIFADFNNADAKGRIRLSTTGSLEDIANNNITLKVGLEVRLDDYESLSTNGTLEFSDDENIWVARIDWDNIDEKKG